MVKIDMSSKDNSSDWHKADPLFEESAVRFDWDSPEQPTTAIIEAVSAITGDDLTEMPPLTHSIDPDALNSILDVEGNLSRDPVYISFVYNGVWVHVNHETGIGIQLATDNNEHSE